MGYYIIACGVGLIQFDHIIIIIICGALPPEQPEMEIKTIVLILLKESKNYPFRKAGSDYHPRVHHHHHQLHKDKNTHLLSFAISHFPLSLLLVFLIATISVQLWCVPCRKYEPIHFLEISRHRVPTSII